MRVLRLAPLLAVLAAGCAKEFTPRSVLFDLRVLAIVPTPADQPLELGPSDSLTLQAVRVPPPGGPTPSEPWTITDERWTFCPFSIGASAGYACAVHGPTCEVPLQPSGSPTRYASAPVTASPGALALACLESLAASGALPPNVPSQLPEKFDVLFRYVVTASDGSPPREAVQRIPVYPAGAPAVPNVAPIFDPDSVQIGGTVYANDGTPRGPLPTLSAGDALDVLAHVSASSAQTYVEGGRTLTETLVVSFYTTAGRFDFDRANGPDASVKLKGEELVDATPAQVWAVVRDLRGGEAVAGPFTVNVSPDRPARPFP